MIRERAIRLFTGVVVGLRYLIVPAWIAAALAVSWQLPGLGSGEPLPLGGLIPEHAESIGVAEQESRHFGLPLTTDTLVVQRDPDGLSAEVQTRAVERAVRTSREPHRADGIQLALPITNTLGLFPGSQESNTTAVTYLFFGPDASLPDRVSAANVYVGQIPQADSPVGVTGPAPARLRQFNEISASMTIIELGTVGVILLVVGFTFRALGAPLLTLFAAGLAFLVARGVIPWIGTRLGVSVPQEVEPLVVALTLGVVTDYSVFYLSGTRRSLRDGLGRVDAARAAALRVGPIVATAGLIVVAGTASLLVGELEFFRAFGPALALTAAVSLVVALTFIPAALAIFGSRIFWPGLQRADLGTGDEETVSPAREALARFLTARPIALATVLLCTAALIAAVAGLPGTKLAFRLITGLPSGTQQARAAKAAAEGFAPGIVAPTVVLVQGSGLGGERPDLLQLEEKLADQPGVVGVLGPREQLGQTPSNLFLSRDGTAARYVLVYDQGALSGPAIDNVRSLKDALPGLLDDAGLAKATAGVTGQTAIASDTVEAVVGSSVRVGAVVLAVNFVLLALFLRALVAPLYLLAASVASVAATLGLTKYVFQDLLGHSDLTYYVPFAAGVLLVSLGSDYNVYVVGRIWQEAGRMPLRQAVAFAAPRASKAIAVAGIALAASFGMLAVVPIDGFREFAFMIGVGVLLETFLVRSLLIPALISLFGKWSFWPGHPAAPPAPPALVPVPADRGSERAS
ncbi:MAG TPA: MMPL family transporter [Gaiellaceae bacterium]|nr:MMPL family transporter [Gaiellaceae bacterium]